MGTVSINEMAVEELSTRQLQDVNVVNIGGPLDNIITSRSQRPDLYT